MLTYQHLYLLELNANSILTKHKHVGVGYSYRTHYRKIIYVMKMCDINLRCEICDITSCSCSVGGRRGLGGHAVGCTGHPVPNDHHHMNDWRLSTIRPLAAIQDKIARNNKMNTSSSPCGLHLPCSPGGLTPRFLPLCGAIQCTINWRRRWKAMSWGDLCWSDVKTVGNQKEWSSQAPERLATIS